VVTATGRRHSLPLATIRRLREGVVLINAGHGRDEIDIDGLRRETEAEDQLSPRVQRYRLGDRTVVVLADGNPLNIVLNSGSQEPVLLHFAVLGLGLEWLARSEAPAGELALPAAIEEDAARLALAVLA
jgi:S-adenosylhomocysteine hydrolase